MTASEVVAAIREQNVQVAAGVIGASPTLGDVPLQLNVNAAAACRPKRNSATSS